MSDFFLGKYGGGIPKAFRYTEIQKHRFNLKSKDSEADRQVPAMPLVFYTKDGRINRYNVYKFRILSHSEILQCIHYISKHHSDRYNLRKFGELPYQLVRCGQFLGKWGLYENVMFNYQWLYAKMSACPLQAVLFDFEDACEHLTDKEARREITLVADSLRLGGAILDPVSYTHLTLPTILLV